MDHDSDSTKWLATAFVLLILAILALLPWHNMESADNSSPAVANFSDTPTIGNQGDLDRVTFNSPPLKDVSEESTLSSVSTSESTSELMVVHGIPRFESITDELCQPNAPRGTAPSEGQVDVRRIDSATESDDILPSSDLTRNQSSTEDHVLEMAAHLQVPNLANADVVHADAEFCSTNPPDGCVRVTPYMEGMEYSPFALQFAAQETAHASGINRMGFTPLIIERSGYTEIGEDLLHRNNLILCSGIRSWGMDQPVVVSELPCDVGSDEEAGESIVGLARGYQALPGKAETEHVSDAVSEKSLVEEPLSVSENESQNGNQPGLLTVAAPSVEIDSFWEGVDDSRESGFAPLAAPLNHAQGRLMANPTTTSVVNSSNITLSAPLGSSIESSTLRSSVRGADEESSKIDEPPAFVAASMATPMPQETLPTPPIDSDQPAIADEEDDLDESEEEEDAAAESDASGDDKADDDKKMLGHLAGKFGYCFRSALSCGFYFGNEFTFLGVESPGYTRVSLTDSVNDRVDQFTGDDAFGFGNRLTLGLRAKNIGFRAIYWAFAAENSSHDALNDIDRAPDFSTSSTARLETFDFDLTQNYCIMGCNLTSSCGFRFAEFQGSELTHLAGGISDLLQATGSTLSHKSMRGLGPSFSMELRKTIPWCLGSPAYMPRGQFDPGCAGCFGCCGSDCNSYGECGGCGGCDSCGLGSPCFPWRVYFNTRISLLWADTYSESITDSVMATGPGVVTQGIARSRDFASLSEEEKATLLSTQLQVGLEYQQPVFCNSALFKMRFGLEFQSWDLGESASMSESFAFLTDPNGSFDGRVDTLSRSDNEYIDLFGFTFLIGLNY
jgi:hypothetical protein